jgi:hypothetical protein
MTKGTKYSGYFQKIHGRKTKLKSVFLPVVRTDNFIKIGANVSIYFHEKAENV